GTVTKTGTPADNYKDAERETFCGTGSVKSNRYITEFKIPTVCTQPLAITTDSSGNVWFTESNTGNLAKFDPFSRTFTEFENTEWPEGDQSMMWGIDHSQDENIWFTDERHDIIWKFSILEKNFTRYKYPASDSEATFPQKLIVDGQQVIVNDFSGNKITFFDTSQSGQEIKYSKIDSPTADQDSVTGAFTIDSNGKLWYTVWKFQQGGNLLRYDSQDNNGTAFKLPLGIQAPNGISSSPEGKIWITDAASSFFFSFDPQSQQFTKFITPPPSEVTYGNSSGLIKTPISRPYWNDFDNKGRLWFNEQTGNSIAVFDPKKESLVEYGVPSGNPNWSDCGNLEDCGVAQVLDFTIRDDKIWFTEWVENNIGVLDSSVPLPFDIDVDENNLILNRDSNVTLTLTISPTEHLSEPVDIVTANTAGLRDITINHEQKTTVGDQPQTVTFDVYVDKFALSGTYKILLGARYHEVTVSEYVTVTVK
ncbi:MAG TPA: lyase, partial [Nitrosopumilaceae archaeon]|nr:lyase [Nitrosopumilaceae archaeon]